MHLNWRQRLELNPNLRDISNWPYIDVTSLDTVYRKIYLRNLKIVSGALKNQTLTRIANQHGIANSLVTYILNRCLAGPADCDPPLSSGLIPGRRLTARLRKSELSNIDNPKGCRGSFDYLLKTVPGLKENLDKLILNHLKQSRYGQNLTPGNFHSEFLRFLRDCNWPNHQYPFDQENLGYETVRKYFHKRYCELSLPKPKEKKILIKSITPIAYQEIQIDSQLQDLNTSINLELDDTFVPIRLSRLALFIAKDVATDCIVSYELCISKDPTQDDLLALLENIHKKWVPLNLTIPGLQYSPGACLPSALREEFQYAGIGVIRLDNAVCHLANTVKDYVCNNLGATLNYGLPGQPKGRNFVEYAFKILSDQTHRFASTTGSNPNDPIKETRKNLKTPPTLTLSAFEEVLSVLITAHNCKAQPRLGGSSPLDRIQYQMTDNIIRMSNCNASVKLSPFIQRKQALVKWTKKENRAPHINFAGTRYLGKGLQNERLINSKIILEYDRRDIRTLRAFTKSGKTLGKLYAPRSWQGFPHSLKTRQIIQKMVRKKRLAHPDPLAGYFANLLEKKEVPKYGTELVRIYREMNHGGGITLETKNQNSSAISEFRRKTNTTKSKLSIPLWSTNLTNDEIKHEQKKSGSN